MFLYWKIHLLEWPYNKAKVYCIINLSDTLYRFYLVI